MYIQKLKMEVTSYIERINEFEIFDYVKEEPYRLHYKKIVSIIGAEETEDIIRCLNDKHTYVDFEETSIFNEWLYNSSLSEKIVATILWINNVPFQHERKLEGSKHRFDFYIENEGTPFVIEVNGSQHYERGNNDYQNRMYEMTIISDSIKESYCQQRGIPLFFIDASKPSFEFILDSIDWYHQLRWLSDYVDKKELINQYSSIFGYPY